MDPRTKNVLKIAILAGFVVVNIAIKIEELANPRPPVAWNDDPYPVGIEEIIWNQEQLEGQSIQVIGEAEHVYHDHVLDSMSFNVSDGYFGVSVMFVFTNWSGIAGAGSGEVRNGTAVTIKGICTYRSTGTIIGIDIQVLHEDRVNVLSLVALAFLVVAILAYFKVDIRRLSLVLKTREAGRRPGGGD